MPMCDIADSANASLWSWGALMIASTHEKAGCFGHDGCSQLFLRGVLEPWAVETEEAAPREREDAAA